MRLAVTAAILSVLGGINWLLGVLGGNTEPSSSETPQRLRYGTDYAFLGYRWGKWLCLAGAAVAAVAAVVAVII